MNRLVELRQEKKIKQIDLAKMLNVSQGTLSNWERGVHEIDQDSMNFLCDFFETSTDYLLGRSDIRRPGEVFAASSTVPYEDLPPEVLEKLESYKLYLLEEYRKSKKE